MEVRKRVPAKPDRRTVGRGNLWESSMGRWVVPWTMEVNPIPATGAEGKCDGATAIAAGARRLLAGDSGLGVATR